jgi:exodeoxyribonuclease VII large subunit
MTPFEERMEFPRRSVPARARPERAVLSVSDVTRAVREILEGSFDQVRVRGEITNLSRPQSGHVYFSLVDDGGSERSRLASAQLACVLWRSAAGRVRFPLENGRRVIAGGRISVYEPRGSYQLVADTVEADGVGDLQLRFEELKERLRAEGLFDTARKRPLPFLPERIGLVTSPTGAAIQDVLRALYRRFPAAWVRIVPVRVQGEGAAEEIAAAVDAFQADGGQVDVIILARGGGSLEDLWSFNDERVARALARSRIPTVAAVGHEVDFSIADFVADARAQTPTHAPDLVVPDLGDLLERLGESRRQLLVSIQGLLKMKDAEWCRLLRSRALRRPLSLVETLHGKLDELAADLDNRLYNRSGRWEDAVRALFFRLQALHPERVLERGFAIALDASGRVVRDAAALEAGDLLRIQLARGALSARVVGEEDAGTRGEKPPGGPPGRPPGEERSRS